MSRTTTNPRAARLRTVGVLLLNRLGEELRRGLKCSHEKHRKPDPPGKGEPQPNSQNRYETVSNQERVSTQISFGKRPDGRAVELWPRPSTSAEPTANVLVNATGLNSFPSGPVRLKTGRNEMMVVNDDVMTAPPTSAAESRMRSMMFLPE